MAAATEEEFKKLLSPGRSKRKFCTVTMDNYAGVFVYNFIDEILRNWSESTETQSVETDIILCSCPVQRFKASGLSTKFYDFYDEDPVTLEETLSQLMTKQGKPTSSRILIIDDFALFASLTCERSTSKLSIFFQKLSSVFTIYVFVNKNTASSNEISMLYNVSTNISWIRWDDLSDAKSNTLKCDILKIKSDGKTFQKSSIIEMVNGKLKETPVSGKEHKADTSSNSMEALKNLTTFKLTLEENEKETKDKLHLPHFDAQKLHVHEPISYEDDFDEEDEEV